MTLLRDLLIVLAFAFSAARPATWSALLNNFVIEVAHFDGADLSQAQLTDTDLTKAKFGCLADDSLESCTRLSGADLSGAIGLTQLQLDGACGSTATKLPAADPPLTLRSCPARGGDR